MNSRITILHESCNRTNAVIRALVTTNGSTLYDFDELESSYSIISVTSNRTSNNLVLQITL